MEDSDLPTSEPPPPPPPRVPEVRGPALAATVLVFGLFITLGGLVQLLNVPFGIWFTEVFLFLGVAWVVLRYTGHSPVGYTGLGFPGLGPLGFGFAVGVANFFALVVPLQFASQLMLPEEWQQIFDAAQLFRGRTVLELAAIILGVTVAAPVCEEFFFRGLLQRGLLERLPALHAVALASVIFSAFHLDPVGFVARVELGILFGLLWLRTGSLWPSILAHSANNLVSTVLFFTVEQGEATTARSATLQEVLSLLVMSLGAGLVMWGLISAADRHPALAQSRPQARAREALSLPAPPLHRLVLPWALGATLSLLALAVVDTRGLRLSLFDYQHALPPLPSGAPDALHAERAALQELRLRARLGEVPEEAYREERLRQVKDAQRRQGDFSRK